MEPTASIVIPTRDRLPYLAVALASVAEQARAHGAQVLVLDDGAGSEPAAALAAHHGARYEPLGSPRGLNAARNAGVERSSGALVVFLDDDVRVREGWLDALLAAAERHPEADVLAGRITAALEGPAPRGCGREAPAVTTLDLGPEADGATVPFAWGSNMAIRRDALRRVGAFDESIHGGGDEQEWQERPARGRESALYVAGAWVEHRRVGRDARLGPLMRSAYRRGRAVRDFDARQGRAPSGSREVLVLGACIAHVLRRRCATGLISVAHSAGRLRASMGEEPAPSGERARGESFLSGHSGTVGGWDSRRRRLLDELARAGAMLSGRQARLGVAARRSPPRRRALVLGVEREQHAEQVAAIRAELARSRHDVHVHFAPAGGEGKFENLNRLLAEHPLDGCDWLLVLDDDVELPRGFLDRFLFLCERFSLTLAQPAHQLDSHAAWEVTRRRAGSVVRETSFVEIGPVTAFASASFAALLPFPQLRMGWGLDLHWAAVARAQGWRCGVIDAVPIRHRQAPAGAGYGREPAEAEAREFLSSRAHLSAEEAQRTLVTHGRW